uniref:Transmembrane protein 207 n=1 Tax=Ornithorhynchus anatinus TaxID=9258 RepID=A0A6I8NL68_ORNAN
MWPGTASSSMSLISKTGILCLILFQFVSSDPPCEENEPCINYNEHLPSAWLIWLFMLLFPAALLCCGILFCLQCWIKRTSQGSTGRTVAVFALNDLDSIYETQVLVFITISRQESALYQGQNNKAFRQQRALVKLFLVKTFH